MNRFSLLSVPLLLVGGMGVSSSRESQPAETPFLQQAPEQAPRMPTPATIVEARQKLIQMQKVRQKARINPAAICHQPRPCEPGPVQPVLDVPGGWCEGIAVDRHGNVYTSDQVSFNIYRVTPQGNASLFAHLYDMNNPDAAYAGALGLEFSRNGDLWVAMLNFVDTSKHGIWKVRPDGSFDLAIPMDPNEIVGPNGLTFDPHENLFIAEVINGAIWKVPKGSSTATLWLAHDLLTPPPSGVFGANGILYKDGGFFVTNTDRGTVLRVPMNPDGTPGEPKVMASDLNGPDGITLGPGGHLYVACPYGGQLVRILKDGTQEIVVDQGLGYPTTPAFGKDREDRLTVYLANFFSSMNGVPSLIKVELCKPPQGDIPDTHGEINP